MSYYTEGYISKIEVSCDQVSKAPRDCPFKGFVPSTASYIAIDPTPPFRVAGSNENNCLILLVKVKNQTIQDTSQPRTSAVLFPQKQIEDDTHDAIVQSSLSKFNAKIDSQFLLMLKQNHTKVRFAFKDAADNQREVESITIL